jgi:hypothetical protein
VDAEILSGLGSQGFSIRWTPLQRGPLVLAALAQAENGLLNQLPAAATPGIKYLSRSPK